MKELTIEEKAKAYDKALERAKTMIDDLRKGENILSVPNLEAMFPELKESDDEKIRKEMIFYFEQEIPQCSIEEHKGYMRKFIAWLEKQGEQKETLYDKPEPKFKVCNIGTDRRKIEEVDTLCNMYHTDSSPIMSEIEDEGKVVENAEDVEQKPSDIIEPKFKVGDWITNGKLLVGQVTSFDGEYYHYMCDGLEQPLHVSNAHKWHLWSIQDAKDGDVLARNNDILSICIFSHFDGINNKYSSFLCHCGLEGEGLGQKLSINGYHDDSEGYVPATKEQRDLLFAKMKEVGYEWDADKKKLKKIEQTAAEWSEEDYNKISSIKYLLHELDNHNFDDWLDSLKCKPQYNNSSWSEEDEKKFRDVIRLVEQGAPVQSIRDHYTNWLKSLKDRVQPQSQWKPSDEQMKLLREVQQALLGKDRHNRFVNFMYELKRLRED